eukprot:TRINITY_DN241_c0_g1_i1.p1 TRINITY_DN241_c0_g1~~TRINITY_DN241_c0_g1_i1.p1  ORF type:complete len:468 (+),score=34.89 TRINITY_DN241_c0_g1_i1:878-2281(+)
MQGCGEGLCRNNRQADSSKGKLSLYIENQQLLISHEQREIMHQQVNDESKCNKRLTVYYIMQMVIHNGIINKGRIQKGIKILIHIQSMKIIVIGLVVILAFTAKMLQCPKYICKKEEVEENKVCAVQTIESVMMRLCKSGEVCPTPAGLEEESLCTRKEDLKTALPGEYCDKDSQCIYGTCKGSVCVSKGKGEACKHDEECNVGLYCSGECTPVVSKGDNCTASTKCDPNTFCYEGVCTLYAQFENGANATIPAVCKSYYIQDGKCHPGPVLRYENNTCPTNNSCYYTAGDKEIYEPCVCGKVSSGEGFCSPGKGEASLKDVSYFFIKTDQFSDYVASFEKPLCHVKRGPLCLYKKADDMPLEFYKAYIAFIKVTQPVSVMENDECVRAIYNNLYWKAQDKIKESEDEEDKFGLYLFLGIAIGAVFVIAILLLVIYFKRRKADEDDLEETTGERLTAQQQALILLYD